MELKVINAQGQVSGSLSVSDALFAREYNEALVHQLVTAYLANARSGNRAQLTPCRSETFHKKTVETKRNRPCPFRYDFLSFVEKRRPRVSEQTG